MQINKYRFRAITPMYIRVADGLILFYDVTHRNSFINIPSWVKFIKVSYNNIIIAKLKDTTIDCDSYSRHW